MRALRPDGLLGSESEVTFSLLLIILVIGKFAAVACVPFEHYNEKVSQEISKTFCQTRSE